MWKEGRRGCDHTEAGWSKAIRDLVFFPAAVWKGLRFELRHKEEGTLHRKRRRGQEV